MLWLSLLAVTPSFIEPDSIQVPDIPQEKHLRNVRQLTFGGQNAEAYWNADGKHLIYQSAQPGYPDEQIFTMDADGSHKRLVSTGKGRCTCSYYYPDGKHILFSSTHERQPGPQEQPDFSKGYVWVINPNYSMYRANPDGGDLTKLVDLHAYVAETTIDPKGRYMVFTSDYQGDLDIYRCDLNGKHIRRLTNQVGYDGGPFVSWDGEQIAYRRDAWTDEKSKSDYLALLKQHLIRPTSLEIWVMDKDGGHKKQVTDLHCASFAPFVKPGNRKIVFSSNFGDKKGREFEIWMINEDGTGLERITYSPEFDGFPMFSRDGKKLVFASNRYGKVKGETNIFVADWVD